jgi:anti-anti-sigma factor
MSQRVRTQAFSVEPGSDNRTFVLTGDLDLASCDQLIRRLEPTWSVEGDITLDVAGLDFMDSCGIRLLITACRNLGTRGKLILRSPTGEVARVLELIRADRFPNLLIQGPETIPSPFPSIVGSNENEHAMRSNEPLLGP